MPKNWRMKKRTRMRRSTRTRRRMKSRRKRTRRRKKLSRFRGSCGIKDGERPKFISFGSRHFRVVWGVFYSEVKNFVIKK